jgi:uncharacterized RDD family membrane protein YckC
MDKFSARETEWMLELDGIPLAGFWQRAFAFVIDSIFVYIIFAIVASALTMGYMAVTHKTPIVSVTSKNEAPPSQADIEKMKSELENSRHTKVLKLIKDVLIPVLYFGLLTWRGKGRTPGKRMMKIRVVSIVHRHLGLWHSVERALGYGAAALEGGFGFVQYFIHPYRRCVQDRIAETIVVTEAGYQAMQHKLEHPLVPDGNEDF